MAGKSEEEIEMMKVMGFGNFDTSKVHIIMLKKLTGSLSRWLTEEVPMAFVTQNMYRRRKILIKGCLVTQSYNMSCVTSIMN